MEKDQEYEVGFGRPPKSTRWPKGHSGNPHGRRKKPAELRSILEAELERSIPVSANGEER
jgi:hypothetical protein